jgi:phosphoglycerate dehydrogenase-like enzyme
MTKNRYIAVTTEKEATKIVMYTFPHRPCDVVVERFPELDIHIEVEESRLLEALPGAKIVFLGRPYDKRVLQAADAIKWLHIGGVGLDRLLPLTDLPPDVILTNSSGTHEEAMANYTLGVIVVLAWDFPRILRNQAAHRWERWPAVCLATSTLGLVGVGAVGRAIARRAKACQMRVLGVKRRVEMVPDVDLVLTPSDLPQILQMCDFVVVSLPFTEETEKFIDRVALRQMKPTAYLINVSRAEVVEQAALLEALREGWIAGAVLDTLWDEPLADDSQLWDVDNLIITPHISSEYFGRWPKVVDLFCRNVERYLRSELLINVIDKERGY